MCPPWGEQGFEQTEAYIGYHTNIIISSSFPKRFQTVTASVSLAFPQKKEEISGQAAKVALMNILMLTSKLSSNS